MSPCTFAIDLQYLAISPNIRTLHARTYCLVSSVQLIPFSPLFTLFRLQVNLSALPDVAHAFIAHHLSFNSLQDQTKEETLTTIASPKARSYTKRPLFWMPRMPPISFAPSSRFIKLSVSAVAFFSASAVINTSSKAAAALTTLLAAVMPAGRRGPTRESILANVAYCSRHPANNCKTTWDHLTSVNPVLRQCQPPLCRPSAIRVPSQCRNTRVQQLSRRLSGSSSSGVGTEVEWKFSHFYHVPLQLRIGSKSDELQLTI